MERQKQNFNGMKTCPAETQSVAASDPVNCYIPRCAFVFYVMAFLGFFCAFALRVNLSVAVVAMVNHSAVTEQVETTNASDTSEDDTWCPRDPALRRTGGEFVWDRSQQGALLAAFYYGHVFTQIPGGWLADRFGGKWLFGGSILLPSIMSLLSPPAARLHFLALLTLRVLSGVGDGVLLPAAHSLIARWSDPKHRSIVVSAIFTGTDAGILIGMLLSGFLSEYGFAGGWPSVFYVFGGIGCIWSAAWFLLCYNSPSSHPKISAKERQHWSRVLGRTNLVAHPPTPWKSMLTSLPVWALAVAFFANAWGFLTLATIIPLFMYDVLGFDMTRNGLVSAVPFAASVLLVPFGLLADWLRAPGRLSTSVVRKIFCAAGFLLIGSMLILTGFAGCNRVLAVFLMFMAIAFSCISFNVVSVNQLDLAPLHAGKIMGLTFFVGNLAPIISPQVVGLITYRRSGRAEWQKVFYLSAVIYAVGALVFVIFGAGERQSWAGGVEEKPRQELDDFLHQNKQENDDKELERPPQHTEEQ